MHSIALQLAYQGTDFHGYQVQPGKRTVEHCLQTALNDLLGESPRLICAGRTDAGVHALAQLVSFETEHRLPAERYPRALKSRLPEDMTVVGAWQLPPGFNARFAAEARHYRYVLQRGGPLSPLLRRQLWHCQHELDQALLARAWQSIQGTHDFRAFCSSGSYRSNFVIPIYWTRCWQHGALTVLELMGQSFLYNMVRTLVGTVVDIARGRLAPDALSEAITSGERARVGSTAPPQGLYFYNVIYPPQFGLQLIRPELHAWPAPLGHEAGA